ncbi:hypothetical protein Y032_0012g1899 [Ancylostoma ceylanicum]|uniref:Uncharacterized protein n=1 Tax=Ancylostoma ceylanicum TaxID=53326 RepID=A0A016VFD0_9BILA|nr:hypothetical protein Y032_0012g1899 [Ancylostoma ceylanicum]
MLYPAVSLGVSPRQDGDQCRGLEVLVCLEQQCEATSNAMFDEVHAEAENKSRECDIFPAADKFAGRMDERIKGRWTTRKEETKDPQAPQIHIPPRSEEEEGRTSVPHEELGRGSH